MKSIMRLTVLKSFENQIDEVLASTLTWKVMLRCDFVFSGKEMFQNRVFIYEGMYLFLYSLVDS